MATLHTMFNETVNAMCNKITVLQDKMQDMEDFTHATYSRLAEFTGLSQSDMQERMSVSAQTMTNWKKRGISEGGALMAQASFGIDANWLLTGKGTKSIATKAVKSDDPDAVMVAGYAVLLNQLPKDLRASWHSHLTQETLKYLVSISGREFRGTNQEGKSR